MRFDNNELLSFLERDNNDINNIIESELIQSMPKDVREIYYEALLKTEKEDPMVTDAKMKYANKQISSVAELEQRLEDIINDDPRSVIRVIKIFKFLNFGLMLLSGFASFQIAGYFFPNTSIAMGNDGKQMKDSDGNALYKQNGIFTWDNFFRWGFGMLGGYILRSLVHKICSADFIAKMGAKVLRWILDCRDSDANKVRMINEVIRTTNRTVRSSKNNIEKEVLIKYMNQAIAKRDEIASRLNFMNKGAPPPETQIQPNTNNNTQQQSNNNTNNQTNVQPQQNTPQPQQQNNGGNTNNQTNAQPQQNNNTPSQSQGNPENVVKNNDENKQQKQS